MESIASLLDSSTLKMEDGYLEVFSELENLEVLYIELCKLGYTGEESIDNSGKNYCLSLNLSADSWPAKSPFYPNILVFWQYVISRKSLPEKFYIIDSKIFSGQEPECQSVKSIKYYFQWRELLSSLKDHGGGEGVESTLVFFISTEKGAKMYELNPRRIDLAQVMEGFKGGGEDKDIASLAEVIAIEDGHQKERRDVLRASLAELLEEEYSGSTFAWLLKQGTRLKKKYHENYDVYLHKFSVNKLLSEIEEKSTDYISKINDSISSSQAKAFAIPGALIAIAALIKNADLFSLLFVCAGLLSVSFLTFVANNIHCEAYGALRDQVQRSLKRYEIIKNEDAVRVSAEEAKIKLLGLIDRAVKRLRIINYLSVSIFLLGVFYTVFSSPGAIIYVQRLLSYIVSCFGFLYSSIFSYDSISGLSCFLSSKC
ncbi:hypothetical protein RMI40_01475 [Pseudomonas protegens]|uniref:hypothetical protein n=1 Tax=Pseudomonas protegens TaxID=380021 RepID=UPI0014749F27|nr:hypothetical protein [Pseudomonas protegens]MDS9873508.1 hypothetical protein [Pseudomonas protegens]NMZ26022.1 hypothetical protein [Pseudomonas protegens]NMZ84657.1 hypothetical protein [Pseudomonas protegens]